MGGPWFGFLVSIIREFKNRLRWKVKYNFITVSKKTLRIKQTANFNSYLKKNERQKEESKPFKLEWKSYTWKVQAMAGGFRERVGGHKILGKPKVLRNTC